VISLLKLILDDHHCVRRKVSPDQVECETTDPSLGFCQFEVHAEGVAKHVGVLQEPECEIVSLVLPDVTYGHSCQSAQALLIAVHCYVPSALGSIDEHSAR
jgi:hypothetical protein